MQLNDSQKAQVAGWIQQGARLSEIQSRLASELGLTLTYMEARFLLDDLKLVPKDPEPPKSLDLPAPTTAPTANPALESKMVPQSPASPTNPSSAVTVTVDQIARPGTLVSGKVSFSDGQKASWTLDQMGRLGLAAEQKGYRPTAVDIEQFQVALQNELTKLGM